MSDERKPPSDERKTYVLMHGAYHGAWCWQVVAERLRARGHRVFTPTSPGLGERAAEIATFPTLENFIDDLVDLFVRENLRDAILVGHSFGGAVVEGAVDRIPERVRHVVFVDAVILPAGMAVLNYAPSEALAFYRDLLPERGGDGAIPVPPMDFFGVSEPEHIAYLRAHLTPQPVRPLFDELTLRHAQIGAGRPVTCIHCTQPAFLQAEPSRQLARTMPGWRHIDIATGHDAMVTAPEELSELLLAIE